ncbi:hypothetical protein J5N97_009260 [Dioscorea zingiberensis]|uniref:Pectinesterase n=1 Tax=Dioscorea zingiberensis TaxID=325984 RepID=A0A9D5CW19_9LILI|nr:hypothetical protein J5N97_009260 [Dioscorea zingiberensis]
MHVCSDRDSHALSSPYKYINPPLYSSTLTMYLASSLLVLFLFATSGGASPAVTSEAACKNSFYPKLCRAMLQPLRFPSDPYEFGRYSVKQALKQARKTSLLLDHYLSQGRGGSRRRVAGSALEDCRELASLNSEYLESVQAELGPGRSVLTQDGVERVKALMSALVTNQQTCYDGLEASRSFPELQGAFSNETRLYGVSLELVTTALARRQPAGGGKPSGSNAPPGVHAAGFRVVGRELIEENSGEVVPVNQSVLVARDGSGNFTLIADAIDAAPNNTKVEDGFFAIFITEGVYQENIVVAKNKKNLILIGAGINKTVITGNRSVIDGWTTFNSATFAVHGERFIALNITFENTAGPEKHQAVAVRNSADLSSFYRCSFLGYQDTLYAHSLRQFYRDCDIYGTVDFIFGNAATVFQHCNLYARKPLPNQFNAITAQGRTHPNQTTGISIHNCTVRAAPDLEAGPAGSTKTFLGRPWKEYSRTVYMQSFIDQIVEPVGWMEWNGSFALSTLYYGEYDNFGPGANTSQRVQWPGYNLMDAVQAMNFTVYNFTTGYDWLPSTSIPFSGGLI